MSHKLGFDFLQRSNKRGRKTDVTRKRSRAIEPTLADVFEGGVEMMDGGAEGIQVDEIEAALKHRHVAIFVKSNDALAVAVVVGGSGGGSGGGGGGGAIGGGRGG